MEREGRSTDTSFLYTSVSLWAKCRPKSSPPLPSNSGLASAELERVSQVSGTIHNKCLHVLCASIDYKVEYIVRGILRRRQLSDKVR